MRVFVRLRLHAPLLRSHPNPVRKGPSREHCELTETQPCEACQDTPQDTPSFASGAGFCSLFLVSPGVTEDGADWGCWIGVEVGSAEGPSLRRLALAALVPYRATTRRETFVVGQGCVDRDSSVSRQEQGPPRCVSTYADPGGPLETEVTLTTHIPAQAGKALCPGRLKSTLKRRERDRL